MFNELSSILYNFDSSYCWVLELVSNIKYFFFFFLSVLSVNIYLWMYQAFRAEVEPNSILRLYYISILICVRKHIFTDKSSFSSQAQAEFKLSRSRITWSRGWWRLDCDGGGCGGYLEPNNRSKQTLPYSSLVLMTVMAWRSDGWWNHGEIRRWSVAVVWVGSREKEKRLIERR